MHEYKKFEHALGLLTKEKVTQFKIRPCFAKLNVNKIYCIINILSYRDSENVMNNFGNQITQLKLSNIYHYY